MKNSRVTVLFGDIKGYTAICQRVDPTALRGLLDELFDISSQVIDGQLGIINKILGDGLIAFFTGEDQAVRAVRAAVTIQEKARQLRPKWQAAADNADLRLRIGIATGIVSAGERKLLGHTEYSLDGEAVTLAARLQEKANPGGVLMSRESYEDVRNNFTCCEMKGLELKGYDDALTAYRVEGGERSEKEKQAAAGRRKADVPDGRDYTRRHQRREKEMEIRYNLGGYSLSGRTVNISAGGLFMDTDALAPVGTDLVLYTKIPTSYGTFPIEIQGRIVRIADGGSYRGVGVEFCGVRADETETTNQLTREIFGINGGTDTLSAEEAGMEDDQEWGFSPHPLFSGSALPLSYDELGTGTPEDLVSRLTHEIKRARRYGTEFALVALKVHSLEDLPSREAVSEVIRDVDAGFRMAVRNTDDIAYYRDGVFLLLAPETMLDRAVTLARRVVEKVHQRVEALPGKLNTVELRTGVASFDGETASNARSVIATAVGRCH
jgi:class 3 adenylate cyclase